MVVEMICKGHCTKIERRGIRYKLAVHVVEQAIQCVQVLEEAVQRVQAYAVGVLIRGIPGCDYVSNVGERIERHNYTIVATTTIELVHLCNAGSSSGVGSSLIAWGPI